MDSFPQKDHRKRPRRRRTLKMAATHPRPLQPHLECCILQHSRSPETPRGTAPPQPKDPRSSGTVTHRANSTPNHNHNGEFVDVVKLSAASQKTSVSSVDPWHSPPIAIPNPVTRPASISSTPAGYNNLPAMIPLAMLYGNSEMTPRNPYARSVAYPMSLVEMGRRAGTARRCCRTTMAL